MTVAPQHLEQFQAWKDKLTQVNPYLELVAKELRNYSVEEFKQWFEHGLTAIFHQDVHPQDAFSPGSLILGANTRVHWREELLAMLTLLEETSMNAAVDGIVKSFDALPPEQNLQQEDVPKQKRKIIEMLKIVRSLRSPLCRAKEAYPLPAIHEILNTKYRENSAIFTEAIMTWLAFAHQAASWKPAEGWFSFFEEHKHFQDEYAPAIAFALIKANPRESINEVDCWQPFSRQMRALANQASFHHPTKQVLLRHYHYLEDLKNVWSRSGDKRLATEMEKLLEQPALQLVRTCHPTADLSLPDPVNSTGHSIRFWQANSQSAFKNSISIEEDLQPYSATNFGYRSQAETDWMHAQQTAEGGLYA